MEERRIKMNETKTVTKKLRAKKPEAIEKRLKMFVYGAAGVGKTWAAIQFPNAYIIDTEKGADFYSKSIVKAGSVIFQSNNADEIREEIKNLLIEKHDYNTLIIDPVTQIYNSIQEKWVRVFEKYSTDEKNKEIQDFGMRFWGKVKSEYKSLQRLLVNLDMNIIVTSHQKDVYGTNFSKIGTTFDSMKGDDYFFDLIFQIEKQGEKRIAKTIKERSELGENKFPETFDWIYSNFCLFYGKDILERESVPISMATKEQVEKIEKLLEIVKVDDAIVNKWFTAADCDSFEQFKSEQIEKCIGYLENQLKPIVK